MKVLNLRPKGLYTNPNTLSEVPEGALSKASNVVCSRPGIVTSRRGLNQFDDTLVAAAKLYSFNSTAMVYADSKLKYDNAGTWSAGQSLSYPATNYRPKSATLNGNFFISSSLGIQKLTSPSATFSLAGVPEGLDVNATVSGASGFLANNFSCRYRIVFGIRDANENLILSSPSSFVDFSNTSGGTRDVSLNFTLPAGLTTSHFYRIYRSIQTNVSPSDELYLSREVAITSGDISTGTITIVDSTADEQLSTNLYTNETQETILQANDTPPFALDLANYQNTLFFLNTRQKHYCLIKLVKNPAVNDTITINSVVYTAKGTETIASGFFDRSGTIDATARSLQKVINRYTSNSAIYAYYLGEGVLVLRRRDFTDTAFSVSVSVAASWSIENSSSINDAKPGRLYYSKQREPEGVPYLNFIDVGDPNKSGIRIVPVEDALYIFKEDGVFRLTGTSPQNYVVEEHAATVRLRGDENAVRFENVVVIACNQGIGAISSGGYTRVSEAIDNDIQPLLNFNNLGVASFACSYDTERLFLLGLPANDTATAPSLWYAYSAETQQWSTWDRDDVHALVIDEVLYSTKPTQAYKERKTLTRLDYADEEYAVTITGVSGAVVSVSSVTNLEVGQTLKQGDLEGVIEDITGLDLTLDNSYNFVAGAAVVYVPILCEVEFVEQTAGDPTRLKHFTEQCGVFEDAAFAEITFAWASNLSNTFINTTIQGRSSAPWGTFPWGTVAWGGSFAGKQAFRTYIPRNAARALWIFPRIALNQAFNSFSFSGISLNFMPMSERFRSR